MDSYFTIRRPLTNEENLPEETTEVIHGAENIVDATLEQWSKLRYLRRYVYRFRWPSMFVIPNHPVTFDYRKLKERGIRLSYFGNKQRQFLFYAKFTIE